MHCSDNCAHFGSAVGEGLILPISQLQPLLAPMRESLGSSTAFFCMEVEVKGGGVV